MLNSIEFSKRLQKVITFYEETASSFAEKIGVQRSSISHILSGRNKPSLDFILKILDSYPEVELYWLLNGKGTFPVVLNKNTSTHNETTNLFTEVTDNTNTPTLNTIATPKDANSISTSLKPELPITDALHQEAIERIVIFFKNGSFKAYNP